MLTHTSGIELDNIEAFNEETKNAESVEELLESQLKYIDQLEGYSDFELPEKFDYTNEGINLLGVIFIIGILVAMCSFPLKALE